MLLNRKLLFCGIFMMALGSCGGGSQVEIEVVLASNGTQNELKKISQDMQLGLSAGIFFVLDELKTVPVSINDLLAGGINYSEPDISAGLGNDPLQSEFKISTSTLSPNSFYRVRMIARNINGGTTHIGTSDCPVKISLKETNSVRICFGVDDPADPPLCAGLTNFNDCPGI